MKLLFLQSNNMRSLFSTGVNCIQDIHSSAAAGSQRFMGGSRRDLGRKFGGWIPFPITMDNTTRD